MKAAILAGGYGKRLRPLTDKIPKNLVPINGKPIIQWQIEWLKHYGVKEFILLTGYLGDVLEREMGDGSKLGVKIVYCREKEPLGTGGAILNAADYLRNEDIFIVANGDILSNIDVSRMNLGNNMIGGIALVPLPSPYGVIEVDNNMMIRGFLEKPLLYDKWINGGVYIFTSEIFNYLPNKGSIEHETFPFLAKKGYLKGFPFTDVFWMSIETMKDVEMASMALEKMGSWP